MQKEINFLNPAFVLQQTWLTKKNSICKSSQCYFNSTFHSTQFQSGFTENDVNVGLNAANSCLIIMFCRLKFGQCKYILQWNMLPKSQNYDITIIQLKMKCKKIAKWLKLWLTQKWKLNIEIKKTIKAYIKTPFHSYLNFNFLFLIYILPFLIAFTNS